MQNKQLSFNSSPSFKDHVPRIEHGHGIRVGKRKLSRPFHSGKTLHVTLRSSRAKGAWSFLRGKNQKKVSNIVYRCANRFGIKVYKFANSGNHLHLLVKARTKQGLQNFLRSTAGLIPRTITNAQKRQPIGKFWDGLAYSKLISWGKQFKNTSNYVLKNTLEAFGIIPPRSQAKGHIKLEFQALFDG